MEGNCPPLLCLDPRAQREGGGALCPSPIIQGHEPGGLSSELPEDYYKERAQPAAAAWGVLRAARSVVRGPGGVGAWAEDNGLAL